MTEDRTLTMPSSLPEPLKQVGGGNHANAGSPAAVDAGDEAYQSLRDAGGRAWQLQAAARAADHFIGQDASADRSTGSWLVACAVDLADEVAGELDAIARQTKDHAALAGPLHKLRARAHKLHAAARAADHFLDRDTSEDRSTASWLVACALELASKLAAELDDQASQWKRGNGGGGEVARRGGG